MTEEAPEAKTVADIARRALGLLEHDDRQDGMGWCSRSAWPQFEGDIHTANAIAGERGFPHFKSVRAIGSDLWILLTIVEKLDWMQSEVQSDRLDKYVWMRYAAVDVESFHVQYRSLFDHLAPIIAASAKKKGVAPNRSFNDLCHWLERRKGSAEALGPDLAQLVMGACTWVLPIRDIRDSLVHHGEESLVFPMEDAILFQIGWMNNIVVPEAQAISNLSDFRRYAAIYLARLMVLLDDLVPLLRQGLGLPADTVGATFYHPGYGNLSSWLQPLVV